MEKTLVAMPEKKVCFADFELDFGRFQTVSQTAGTPWKVSYWFFPFSCTRVGRTEYKLSCGRFHADSRPQSGHDYYPCDAGMFLRWESLQAVKGTGVRKTDQGFLSGPIKPI